MDELVDNYISIRVYTRKFDALKCAARELVKRQILRRDSRVLSRRLVDLSRCSSVFRRVLISVLVLASASNLIKSVVSLGKLIFLAGGVIGEVFDVTFIVLIAKSAIRLFIEDGEALEGDTEEIAMGRSKVSVRVLSRRFDPSAYLFVTVHFAAIS